LIKAYTAIDRNCDSDTTLVVFAETSGKAKAYAANTDELCDYGFTGIRVNRCKDLDRFYKGKPEMDWMDDEDRVAMVRYAGFECSCEVWHPECEHGECPAQQWCGRYERMND
jgi:hypothetical protein